MNKFRSQEERDAYNAKRRAAYAQDHEKRIRQLDSVRRWQANNKQKRLEGRLKRYGIGADEYAAILSRQQGRCAICLRSESPDRDHRTGRPRGLHVDHCHTTGVVRGILCSSCNLGIGLFRDSTELLAAAISYLKNKGHGQ